MAHGQKDITSLVSLVRIKVFEVDGGGGGRGEGGGKGRREVENRKLVQLVSILTNQIFRSILDTRADLRERKAELVARAKAAEEKTVASYGTRGEGDLCEREVGSRIRERGEEEEDAGRELRDLEEGQQQARAVEGRLDGLLAEQGRVQEEKAGSTQGGLDGHWKRLEEDWKAVEERQKERQGKLENVALEREDFSTRVNDQVDHYHHHCHRCHRHHHQHHRHHNDCHHHKRVNYQVHKEHGNLVETIEEEAKVDLAR